MGCNPNTPDPSFSRWLGLSASSGLTLFRGSSGKAPLTHSVLDQRLKRTRLIPPRGITKRTFGHIECPQCLDAVPHNLALPQPLEPTNGIPGKRIVRNLVHRSPRVFSDRHATLKSHVHREGCSKTSLLETLARSSSLDIGLSHRCMPSHTA